MIRTFLNGNENHPTADEVYLSMRETDPSISLGTVYRNLNQLAENGEIRRIAVGNGRDRYDYRMVPHGHFLCRGCGKIHDFFFDEAALTAAATGISGRVEQEEVILYGTCDACIKQAHETGQETPVWPEPSER